MLSSNGVVSHGVFFSCILTNYVKTEVGSAKGVVFLLEGVNPFFKLASQLCG